ncbi:TetR family transcriptional regulator C-terminal domain-containing protein [Nocardia beijingensis]
MTAQPAVEQAVRHHMGELADVLAEVITQGRRTGELRADLDPQAAAWAVLSFLAGHRFRAAVLPDRATTRNPYRPPDTARTTRRRRQQSLIPACPAVSIGARRCGRGWPRVLRHHRAGRCFAP